MSSPEKTPRDKLYALILPALMLAIGGGGGVSVYALAERTAALEAKVVILEDQRKEMIETLQEIKTEIKDGNQYIRDEVVKTLAVVQSDIAVLKSRP